MSNWMRRRIERSRARCEKVATNDKTVKPREAEKRPELAGSSPLASNAKGN